MPVMRSGEGVGLACNQCRIPLEDGRYMKE